MEAPQVISQVVNTRWVTINGFYKTFLYALEVGEGDKTVLNFVELFG